MTVGIGRRGCGGFTLLEALVALVLACALLAMALSTVVRQRELLRRMGGRAERLDAVRVARHVLGQEARAASGEGAWSAGQDSLALRSFRGHALVCAASAGKEELTVAVEGVRAPEPGKDSVLLLRANGLVEALALLDRRPLRDPCPAGAGPLEAWVLSGPAPRDAVAARWFERGSYHLTGRALRYRRGLGGRQPLTPEVLSTPPSGFTLAGDGRTVLASLEDGAGPERAWLVRMGAPR